MMDILIKIMIGCFMFSAFMFLVYGLLKLFKLDDKIIETEQQRKDRETRQIIEECVRVGMETLEKLESGEIKVRK